MEDEDDAVAKKQHIDETDQGKGNISCLSKKANQGKGNNR
jgi:hypothetical protein